MLRVGVIGSGIAGLYAAYRFSLAGAQVTIFERQAALGMGAHSFEMPNGLFGDVPSRMLNALLWPQLFGLYEDLGINVVAVSPTQTFFEENHKSYLTLDVAYRPVGLLTSILSGKSRRILLDADRLMKSGPRNLSELDKTMTFQDYLSSEKYSEEFVYSFLYPTLSSTVCTCSYEALDRYPAGLMLSVLQRLTGAGLAGPDLPLLNRVEGGTQQVIQSLTQNVASISTSTSVQSVRRQPDSVEVIANQQTYRFDHVIMATQANTASRLISDIRENENKMLNSVCYEDVFVSIHQDANWMPKRRKDWATFNMKVEDGEYKKAVCTVWMNRFHEWPKETRDIFQTISAHPNAVEAERCVILQRPVVTHDSYRTWDLLEQQHLENDRRLWFVGSWAT